MGLTDFSNPELMTNYIRMTREEDFPIRLLVAYGPPFVKKPFEEALDSPRTSCVTGMKKCTSAR